MADICRACVMRAQRSTSAAIAFRPIQTRTFTATAHQRRVGPPVFDETDHPELDQVLSTLREKHIIPAYLSDRQRHLIYGTKFKTELENTPAYATLGHEEIRLNHVDRTTDIPPRRSLVTKAIDLMKESGNWQELPNILEGLHRIHTEFPTKHQNTKLRQDTIKKALRLATQAGHLPTVIRCLKAAKVTGVTLNNDEHLGDCLWEFRKYAQTNQWSQESLQMVMQNLTEFAQLLESEHHGTGRKLRHNDPRTRPAVIAIFLELNAIHALKYNDKKDQDGKVRMYAERLMACCGANYQASKGFLGDVNALNSPEEFRGNFPIWHGLKLARAVLGHGTAQTKAHTQTIIDDCETRLKDLVEQYRLVAKAKPRSYAADAIETWDAAIRV